MMETKGVVLTDKDYRRIAAEKCARNKGFQDKRDYDKADKRARVLSISLNQYCVEIW